MHWSCPHCGVTLAVSDEKVSTGWSFSRCYKCAGFALVRKAEINVIKVDQAPPGERVLLPEGSPDPSNAMLSQKATQRLYHTLSQGNKADSGFGRVAPGAADISAQAAAQFVPVGPIPAPLPEVQPTYTASERMKFRPATAGIVLTGFFTLLSGGYFVFQGQQLWKKTQSHALTAAAAPATVAEAEKDQVTDQVQQAAMAPLRDEPPAGSTWVVKVKTADANFHTGPGMDYPISKPADPQKQYIVSDWKNQWFRLKLADNTQQAGDAPKELGWVKKEYLELLWAEPQKRE